jgi:ferrochelatase
VPAPKVGILLANLGTPDNYDYWSMRRYLSEFLSDRRVIDYSPWKWQPLLQLVILSKRPFTSGAAYKSIWNHEAGESPLMTITKQQTAKIKDAMQARYGDAVMVDYCMRYGNPSTQSKVAAMTAAGCQNILFVPLYPQYAGATSATANDAFFAALAKEKWQPAARTVEPYFDRPDYIEALATSIEKAYAKMETKPDKLLCSYHGVPLRYLMEGDPYHCQCQKTTRLLKERLGWDDTQIMTTFQSKFGPEEWLQPYTVEEVARQAEAGNKKIAVCAPAFSADCIETLEEINEEIKESFEHAGGEEFHYIPCLNDDDLHIKALSNVIEENLQGWID